MAAAGNCRNFEPVRFDVEWILALASERAQSSDAGLAAETEDLRHVLSEAWGLMRPAQRHVFMLGDEVHQTVEGAGGDWPGPTYGTQDGNQTALKWLLQVARNHGEDEPDHEVGDLQQFVRAAWPHLDVAQQRAIVTGPAMEIALELMGIEMAPSLQDLGEDEVDAALDHHGLDTNFLWTDQDLLDCCNTRRLSNRLLDLQTHTIGIDERARGQGQAG